MNEILLIKLLVLILAIITFSLFMLNFTRGSKENLTRRAKRQTAFTGFIANFLDTFGIGSFASIFALRNLFKLMPENVSFNGTMVLQAVLPTMLQSFLFLELVKIDELTLFVSCVMIAIGGIISGLFVKYVSRITIYNVMLITFILTTVVIILNQVHLLSIGGELIEVRGIKLVILGIVMFLAGCLPAFGVGYYSIVLVIIFLLGLSPAVAYPIMTTASAVQMPMTAIPMIKNRRYYPISTIIMTVLACVAVMIAAPIISKVNSSYLKWVLLIVLFYNIWVLIKAKRARLPNLT